MKRLLTLLLTTLGVVALSPVRAQLTTDDHLTDFDFALRQVEANYAGFPSKMEAGNRAEYQLLKTRLAEGRRFYSAPTRRPCGRNRDTASMQRRLSLCRQGDIF